MGRLTMTEAEYNYYADNIREGFELIGQKAVLFQVDKNVADIYHDKCTTYKDGINISLIFEDNPKPILKKLNWMSEDDELPIVANIVALADDGTPIVVLEDMKILLISELGLKTQKLFIVSRVTANNIDPLVYICKLVPYRFKTLVDVVPMKDGVQGIRDDKGFSMLKGKI